MAHFVAEQTTRPSSRSRTVLTLLAISLLGQAVALYTPGSLAPTGTFRQDKLVHFLIFGLPAALSVLAGGSWRRMVPACLVVHAVVSEFVQAGFVPNRSGDPRDALADLVGVGLGWALAAGVAARRSGGGARGGPGGSPRRASYGKASGPR